MIYQNTIVAFHNVSKYWEHATPVYLYYCFQRLL